MSIKNLEFTGLKDQNIICNNLEVKGIVNGNLNVNGEVLASSSKEIGSVGPILKSKGTHVWSSGQGSGVNILSIPVDLDTDDFYTLKFDFILNTSVFGNFLKLNFNNNYTEEYSYRVTQDGAPNTTIAPDFQGAFLKIDLGVPSQGIGEFNIGAIGDIISASSVYYTYEDLPFIPFPFTGRSAVIYKNSLAESLTSINIDISDANHTGTTVNWSLYKG